MNITEFLNARIAEDEKRIDDAMYYTHPDGTRIRPNIEPWEDVETVKAEIFRREVAECVAKRQILRDAGNASWIECQECGVSDESLRAIAAVYADHPDYNEEWTR